MSTSCMQAIKQQLEDMPLEEFEDLLKGVAVNKNEGLPQHAELLSQIKHHVKVPPDEPIQTKASEKDCRMFFKSLNQKEKGHRLSNSSSSGGGAGSNINGNAGGSGNHNLHYTHQNHPHYGSSSGSRGFPVGGGDQNANPLSSTSEAASSNPYFSHPQGKFSEYNNHYNTTLTYGDSLDGDPDDDYLDDAEHPSEYIGNVPSQYILPTETKLNRDLPTFPKQSLSSCGTSQSASGTAGSIHSAEATSSASWDLQSGSQLQLNDGYKSVSSLTSGVTSYMGRSVQSSNDSPYGTIRSVSPTLPPASSSAILSKSPTLEGSHLDKTLARRAGERKKKSAKNVLRETVINPENMPGYKGQEQDIDKLLEFVEGSQTKTKKQPKDKKRDAKPKGNEKQVLSKAASLDENSLGYGSKKGDDSMSRNRTSKDIEKKNSTNITKSSTAICSVDIADSAKTVSGEPETAPELPLPASEPNNSTPMVNGTSPVISKSTATKVALPSSERSYGTLKSQTATGKTENSQPPEVVPSVKAESRENTEWQGVLPAAIKAEEEKFSKPDESDGPYVLVQSKKKREKKKMMQQRESENFARSHVEQARREGGRGRRVNTERRKSVGSVPGSECSDDDDDDSVRSLPAGECTPRERIPKPCSSSGGTPQTSYADIARMSRDETGKTPNNSPISLLPTAAKTPIAVKSPSGAVASDSNFPALSPPNTIEKTAPVGAAVWPCRQRLDMDSLSKEKSPVNSKSEDTPKEGVCPILPPPQQNSANPIPPTCSSKSISEAKEASSQDKTSLEKKISSKDMSLTNTSSTSSSTENEPEKDTVQIKCNGAVPPSGSSVDIEQSIHNTTTKSLGTKKSDEKKAKDKSAKASEEVFTKSNSFKGMENGDSGIHSTEPVVFCGGKFDGPNLPVGQKIGFEFGFGVIEALNDNNGINESSSGKAFQEEFPPISIAPASGTKEIPEQNRSQDRAANSNPETKMESQNPKKDQVSKSVEKQSNKNGSIKPKVFQASDSLPIDQGGSREALPRQAPTQQSRRDDKAVEPTQPPQSAAPCPSNPEKASESSTPKVANHEGKKAGDADIAQIYKPPNPTTVPDTVLKAMDYMNDYATRLTNLSKEGRVSCYRIV